MVTIVWEYQVKVDHIAEFEKIYAPDGKWTELFKRGGGFLGSRLIQNPENPELFVTVDQWESLKDYKAFLSQWKKEYDTLDRQCETLTEHESCLGTFGAGSNEE